jgi:SAM-dependent methyltransferase
MTIDDRIFDEMECLGVDSDIPVEAECYRLVRDALVSDETGKIRPRRRYWRMLEPYSCNWETGELRKYPMDRIGLFARATEDRLMNWVNVPLLTRHLDHGSIGYLFSRMGASFHDKVDFVKGVIHRIGAESYTPEWEKESAQEQIDGVIEESTNITLAANDLLACTLAEKIIYHFSGGERRPLGIVDYGTGKGNTITSVVDLMEELAGRKTRCRQRPLLERYPNAVPNGVIPRIPKDYCDDVSIFLVDVNEDSLDHTIRRIISCAPGFERLLNAGRLVGVRDNFINLPHSRALQRATAGHNVGIAVSGAALCHQTEFAHFFRHAYSLLGKGGVMHIWDWYNGPSFAAPLIRLSEDGVERTVFSITGHDGRVYFRRVPEGVSLSREEESSLYEKLAVAKSVSVVYETKMCEALLVLANFKTWLGLMGYVDRGGYEKKALKVGGEDVDVYLERVFHKRISMGSGFSYFDFLEKVLEKKTPLTEETAYHIFEGTGVNYAKHMLGAHFAPVLLKSLVAVDRDLRSIDEETKSGIEPAHQITYSMGRK